MDSLVVVPPHLYGLSVLLSLLPIHLECRGREEDDVGLEIGVMQNGQRGRLLGERICFCQVTEMG